MNFTGKLEGLKMDYATRKQSISVEVNEDARDAFQELKDCEKLDIQIKKHREKRSLDANAYYWVLITKFAKKLELSNPEAHKDENQDSDDFKSGKTSDSGNKK